MAFQALRQTCLAAGSGLEARGGDLMSSECAVSALDLAPCLPAKPQTSHQHLVDLKLRSDMYSDELRTIIACHHWLKGARGTIVASSGSCATMSRAGCKCTTSAAQPIRPHLPCPCHASA